MILSAIKWTSFKGGKRVKPPFWASKPKNIYCGTIKLSADVPGQTDKICLTDGIKGDNPPPNKVSGSDEGAEGGNLLII
jgi:hypothetical protein